MPLQVFGSPAPQKKSLGQQLGEGALGFAEGAINTLGGMAKARAEESRREEFRKSVQEGYDIFIPKNASPQEAQEILRQQLNAKSKEKLYEKKREGIENILKGTRKGRTSADAGAAFRGAELEPEPPIGGMNTRPEAEYQEPQQEKLTWADYPDEEIAQIKAIDRDFGITIENAKARELEQKRHEETLAYKREQDKLNRDLKRKKLNLEEKKFKTGEKKEETKERKATKEAVTPLHGALHIIDEMEKLGRKGNLGIGTRARGIISPEARKDASRYETLGKSLISFATTIPIRNRIEFETLAHGLYDPTASDATREGILEAMKQIITNSLESYNIGETAQGIYAPAQAKTPVKSSVQSFWKE